MEIHEHIRLWDHAYCRIVDIRRVIMHAGEGLQSYFIPASLFVMSVRGSAQLIVDGTVHGVRRFKVLHAGKGAILNISAGEEGFEYYSVYYKASIPSSAKREMLELEERLRPFHKPYSFVPAHPVVLYRYLVDMHKEWGKGEQLGRLHAKALFHQYVCELLQQMKVQGRQLEKRDLAAQIISIIHERYAEGITLESLSDSLNYSVPHLSSYFKSRTGLSPIDYLIKVRVDKAADLLLHTDATLGEIAAGVGYQDPYYLGRLFKKHKGVSPTSFRAERSTRLGLEDSPSPTMISSIASPNPPNYTEVGDNDYQQSGEEEIAMYTGNRMKAVALLSFMLLLSACGSTTAGNKEVQGSGASPQATAAAEQSSTKVVSTVIGDVEVPVHPERIVAGEYLGSLIALGVIPVGTSSHHIVNPYLSKALEGVENLGEGNGDLEKILAMEPDLIIMDDMHADINEQLPKIAPTVIVPFASLKTVHDEVSYFGELLGKEQEAEQWLADYDRRTAEAKEKVLKVVPADSTFSILEWIDGSVSAVGANYGKGGHAIYNGFGFKPPAVVSDELLVDPGWATISNEALPDYAGDYIILTTNTHTIEDLKGDPIWGTLDAVKNDRVYIWGTDRSWYWDPIAILSQTEELADWLVKG